MLKAANTSVEQALRLFNGAGITVGLLVPTETGCKKSIMDATLSMRSFLHEAEIHNYATQQQGLEAKAIVSANFVLPDRLVKTSASLYRPITKKGDPRIWFSRLTHYCAPTDLLAVIALRGELFVFNMSEVNVVQAFGIPGSCPHEILSECAEIISPIAKELLDKLREIHRRGFIQGISHGDFNVGVTLENLLGIKPNTSQNPDYKGIELKASRKLGQAVHKISKTKKVTLFTKTPDWERSKFNAHQILEKFGYVVNNRLQLYCTVSDKPNSQGLYLDAHDEIDLFNKAKTASYTGDVAVWSLEGLKKQFSLKHNETFWVQASSQISDGKEFFQYDLVRHTRKPNVSNLASLIDAGIVTLDYSLSLKPNGKIRDHGYLFRTTSDKFAHIFPLERVYELG
ncbi:MAG: MvaI/BcnI restriction endonuclease family protein [Kiritimatiellae bacterium]|nr:MvaI/BcnI restriction endonuclease family protein [Kiritimatiellia bacterium]